MQIFQKIKMGTKWFFTKHYKFAPLLMYNNLEINNLII